MATALSFALPVGSTAVLTATEVRPLTTPEGVVIEIVGSTSACAICKLALVVKRAIKLKIDISFFMLYHSPVNGQSAKMVTVLPA